MKIIEIRRHAPDDDRGMLTSEGEALARRLGETALRGRRFVFAMSTVFYRTVQTLVLLGQGAGDWDMGCRFEIFDIGEHEPWYALKRQLRTGINGMAPIEAMLHADSGMVEREASRLSALIQSAFQRLRDGEEGLIICHSEVIEVAVYGLCGYQTNRTVRECEGFRLARQDDGSTSVEELRL